MEHTPNNPDAPITAGVLSTEFGKFEERLDKKLDKLFSEQTKAAEQLLADQANVILEAVDELVEKKLDKKLGETFDPVITKLDEVLKQFEDHRDEDIAGAEQLRRHENQLVKLEARVCTLETAATRA